MDDEKTLSPAEMLDLLDAERFRAARALEPDPRVLFAVWGAAWLIGFLVSWFSVTDGSAVVPTWPSQAVFSVCVMTAVVVTVIHSRRRAKGIRGSSSRVGVMFGWAWFLAFAALAAIMAGAIRSNVEPQLIALLWSTLSGLVVGALYLAGGAAWHDRVQYALGVWILVSSSAGALAGFPYVYLVMGLAGGGGFLVAAAFFAVRRSGR